ncbi:MAG: hypothetical protein AAFZ63_15875 [Bacteroidota bacterium]
MNYTQNVHPDGTYPLVSMPVLVVFSFSWNNHFQPFPATCLTVNATPFG